MKTIIVLIKNCHSGTLRFSKTFNFLIPLVEGKDVELFGYKMRVTYQSLALCINQKKGLTWFIECEDILSGWGGNEIEALEKDGWEQY